MIHNENLFPILIKILWGIPLLFLISCQTNLSTPLEEAELIAHRGASHTAPENTLAAIEQAWQEQADAVEVDVRLTLDSQVVLIHDKTTARTTPRNLVVARTPYDTLVLLDAGSWKSEEFREERIPLLEEALQVVPEGKRIFIEIKSGPTTVEPLREVIQKQKASSQVVIIGFDLETMRLAKQSMPDIPVYLDHSGNLSKNFLNKVREADLDGLDLHHRLVNEASARRILDQGLDLLAWTVNDPQEAARLLKCGVKGITTDRPGYLRKILQEKEIPQLQEQ